MAPSTSSSSLSTNNRRRHNNVNNNNSKNNQHRVILLLDLDCFYAQCECIRLGFDATVTPLSLLQWDSALAVTYPARERFQIKRGDGWECIRRKSRQSRIVGQQQGQQRQQQAAAAVKPKTQQQQQQQQRTQQGDDQKKGVSSSSSSNNETQAFDECLAIHVPLLTTTNPDGDAENNSNNNTENNNAGDLANDTIEDEYNRIFDLSPSEQKQCRLKELGVRKFSHQGKACIERYRIASARIFTTVLEYCQQLHESHGIILERASIDEFFLDVTQAVASSSSSSSSFSLDDTIDTVREGTVIVGQGQDEQNSNQNGSEQQRDDDDDDDNTDHVRALWRGCAIAHGIRTAVRQKLGFTLSAGVGPNKSVAKLSASYGKPNGQAVTFPQNVAALLDETPISSCRNLGGKRGAQIQALLPPNVPTTVGSIARYLSLPDLQQKLAMTSTNSSNTEQANATAIWVYNLARGIDAEPVVSKSESALLTKSLTAFKSLPHNAPSSNSKLNRGHSLTETKPWIRLLAQELVNRVERDAARHARYPRNCTIHYTVAAASQTTASTTTTAVSRTIRMPFPSFRLSTKDKIDDLCTKPFSLIGSKERNQHNHLRITRIGLCAVDFLARDASTRSIDSYFQNAAAATAAPAAAAAPTTGKSNNGTGATTTNAQLDNGNDSDVEAVGVSPESMSSAQATTVPTAAARATVSSSRAAKDVDADLELARKMQAQYDGEARIVEAMDKREKRPRSRDSSTSPTTNEDSDLELAKTMQAQYNREARVLEALDGMEKKSRRGSNSGKQMVDKKTPRIDSFFSKR